MTNLVAIVVLLTNSIVSLDPDNETKHITRIVSVKHSVSYVWNGQTNTVSTNIPISTNHTRMVWCEVPLKIEREPLGSRDKPPMPVK